MWLAVLSPEGIQGVSSKGPAKSTQNLSPSKVNSDILHSYIKYNNGVLTLVIYGLMNNIQTTEGLSHSFF